MTNTDQQPQIVLRRIDASARYIGWMINIIAAMAGAISLIVVGSVLWLAILAKPIPDVLANWGGIILGFYFGQSISLVKDYMGVMQANRE